MSGHLKPRDGDSMDISSADGDDKSSYAPQKEVFGDYEREFPAAGATVGAAYGQSDDPTVYDTQTFVIPEDRKLGYWSTAAVICNRMIGTGIFSTPSTILLATGTPAGTLLLWCVGAFLAYCGMAVFLELGTALPRSGGEKVYLERIYRKPKYIATCVYAIQFILLGNTAASAVSCAAHFLRAINPTKYSFNTQLQPGAAPPAPPPDGLSKGLAIGVITLNCLIHFYWPRFGGKYLMTAFAALKILLLVLVIIAGIAAGAGVGFNNPQRDNFYGDGAWKRDGEADAPGSWAAALLAVTHNRGWENANYVLGEVRRPAKTLRVSAPIAVLGVAALYILANIAYFAALPKDVIQKAGVAVAANLFLDVFGQNAFSTTIFPLCIAASAFGNVLAVIFANSRVNQELGKEGVLPWSRFWASDKPFGTPGAALLLHWVFSVIFISVPSSDDTYNFLVWIFASSENWVSLFIGAGLLYLQFSPSQSEVWAAERTDYRVWWPFTLTFCLACAFLLVAPFIPNNYKGGSLLTGSIPYYVFPTVSCCILVAGCIYWFGFAKIWPKFGFTLEVERTEDEYGNEVIKYKHVNRQRETHVEASSTSALPQYRENTGANEMQMTQRREGSTGVSENGENGAHSYPPAAYMHPKFS
ncbi:amino acid transporter [Choiromyces venosus 120613-1]|uniref:Amino acid transporter n=1 Tax=Choiromyces venosus 120613-1 TaxID=1336337 RepID=A0A3N4JB52_9PEZI|nr:amino acid transporter [Choiromyces venosus 120613-1]